MQTVITKPLHCAVDFQNYAFVLLSTSDLMGLTFNCENDFCPYPSSIGKNKLSGQDVLVALGIDGISYGEYGEPFCHSAGFCVAEAT